MEKKSSNENLGINFLLAGIGGLIGAAIAKNNNSKPKAKSQLDLDLNKNIKISVNNISLRIKNLGKIQYPKSLINDKVYYNKLIEVLKLYAFGFYSPCCIYAAAIIEGLLKKEFQKEKNFNDLIERALENKLLDTQDKYYLHGLRKDRNDFIHSIELSATQQDAKLILLILSRFLNKYYNRSNIFKNHN